MNYKNKKVVSKYLKKTLIFTFMLLLVFGMFGTVPNVNAKTKYQLLVEDVTSKYTLDVTSQFNSKVVSDVPNEVKDFWIVVNLNETSLVDYYNSNVNYSYYKSVSEYANSEEGKSYILKTEEKINKAINTLSKTIDFIEVGNIFTTNMTGFTCHVSVEDYLELAQSALVSDIIVSSTFDVPDVEFNTSATTSASNATYTYSTGIYDTSNVEFDGSGMVIAVLDTGCDINHSTMRTMPTVSTLTKSDIEEVLTDLNSYELSENKATSSDLYKNEKIVYAYDYADKDFDVYPGNSDHGLHVAGIIAGDDGKVTGSASKAQLAIMKVFSSTSTGASSIDIIAALEDCVLLDVDVINMSLGASCGFTREDPNNDLKINDVYDSVKEAGINLVVAAGNSYSSGYGAETTNSSLVTNPDSGTVGSPAAYSSSLSVASIDTELSPYLLANGSTSVFFRNASDSKEEYDFIEEMLGTSSSKTLDYVYVSGAGNKTDYAALDVKDKVVLVQRGTITFEKKQRIAAEMGAAACIVYNNTSGFITMSITEKLIPTVSISQVAGTALAELEEGTITIARSLLGGPFISSFSSWGPSPDLELQPEITAPGGTIYSGYRAGYAEASGTSMASPNLAGVVSLVRQYVQKNNSDLSKIEQATLVDQLLMSTAEIIKNENGDPYSPRKQGSGLANVTSALNTQAYLTVTDSTKTKISLGDDASRTGNYKFSFNVVNTGSTQLVYTLNPYVMTEGSINGATTETTTVTEMAHIFEDCNVNFTATNASIKGENQIVVPANETAIVNVEIQLTEDDMMYLDTNFRYGMYIEGFVELISNSSNGVNLSIPYLGFYGDWTEAPIFDTDMYSNYENETTSAYYETTPLGLYAGSYLLPLGHYVYRQQEGDEEVSITTDKAAISYLSSSTYALYSVYAGMFRNAKTINYEITDTLTGETILSQEVTNGRKSYYNNGPMPHGDVVGISPYSYSLPNNRNYTFTMTALLDYKDGGLTTNANNTFTFSFYVDYEAPNLIEEECMFYTEVDTNGKVHYFVDLAMFDNQYLMAFAPCSVENSTATMLSEYFIPTYDEIRNGNTYTTLEITDYMEKLNNNTLAIYMQDYAMNTSIFTLDVPEDIALTYADTVEVENTEIEMDINQTVSLGIQLTPSNAWMGSLQFNFKDSDGEDANDKFVQSNGQIKALSSGSYVLNITDTHNENINIEINISVSENEVEETEKYQDFSFASIIHNDEEKTYSRGFEVYSGDTVSLKYDLLPWNSNIDTITYRSGDEDVATVDENGLITFKDVFEETTVRITVTINNISHSTSFVVSSPYEVENGQLMAYHGSETELVIPNNLNIFYLYIGCFMNNKELKSVVLPENLITINAQAFQGCSSLESVTLPKDVNELYIGANAFYGCSSLTSINLEDAATGIFVGANAFNGCTSLQTIDLHMVVNLGNNAFSGCTSLRSVDLTNVRVCGTQSFYNCKGLVDITLSEYTQLGTGMFYGCTGLLTARIPTATAADQMFYGCTSLTSVVFLNAVTKVGDQAFQGCTSLTNVSFRSTCEEFGIQAFQACSALTSFKLPNGLDVIGGYAFRNCTAITTVTVSKDAVLKNITAMTFSGCSALEKFIVSTGSEHFDTDDYGILYRVENNEMVEVIAVPTAASISGYELPATVTRIGSGSFAGLTGLTSIDLSNVTEIGKYAFYQCTKLQNVVLSTSLKFIDDSAFYQSGLVEVTIPSSVEKLGIYAFAYSQTLVYFEDYTTSKLKEIGAYAFTNITNTTFTFPSNLEIIGENAFYNCKNLESINLPDSCYRVDYQAFALCQNLTEVHLGKLTEAGEYIFLYSSNIKKFSMAEGATTLGEYMFAPTFSYDDWGQLVVVEVSVHHELTEIILPSTVKYIPLYCFAYCDNLTTIDFENITEVGPYAFQYCTGLTEVNLPNVEVLGLEEFDTYEEFSYAFSYCDNLVKVVLPKVKKIYEAAFYNCTALKSVDAPLLEVAGEAAFYNNRLLESINFDNLKEVDDFAFYLCSMIATASYDNVERVGVSGFYSCNSLTSVELKNCKEVADGAFAGCRNLVDLKLPSLEIIGDQTFLSTGISSFNIPQTVEEIGYGVFTGAYNLEEVTVDENNSKFFAVDGVLYERFENEKFQLLDYPSGKTDKKFVVLEGTARIAEYAFAYNSFIENVILPYSLESIGARAFYRCRYLTAYEFTSYHAPVLEANTYDGNIYELNYDNFFDRITTFEGMYMSSPVNGIGYDNFVFASYFEHNFKSGTVATDATYAVIKAIDNIGEFDSYSNLVNGLINYARSIYDRIDDDIQRCLVTNYDVLLRAEEKIASLKSGNVTVNANENQTVANPIEINEVNNETTNNGMVEVTILSNVYNIIFNILSKIILIVVLVVPFILKEII